MHIAIDLDDVVLDFLGGVVHAVNTEYDAGLTRYDIKSWEVQEVLNPIIAEASHYDTWWDWLKERDWLWGNVFGAVPGAIGGISRLRDQGHWLEIVTSKPSWAEHSVWQWLGRWRPRVNQVTIASFESAGGHVSKTKLTEAQLLIDDKPANCEDFEEDGRLALLYDRPHNKLHEGLFRVNDWNEVLHAIDRVSHERELVV